MEFRTIHNLVVVTVITACLMLCVAFVIETFMQGTQATPDTAEPEEQAIPTYDLILDSQDDDIGISMCKVERNTVVSLPYIVCDSCDKEFLGWSPYSNGKGVVFPPNAKLMINENIVMLYGIWDDQDSD